MTVPPDDHPGLWRRFDRERRDPELVFRTYYDDVFRYVRARVPTDEEAEDLVSQVFSEVLPKLGRLSFRGRPVVAFLYTVAGRRLIDRARRVRPGISLDHAAADEAAAPEGADPLAGGAILDALARLPEEQRLAVYLSCVRGWSHGEVARVLGRSEKAAKQLAYRGLDRVRDDLKAAGVAP